MSDETPVEHPAITHARVELQLLEADEQETDLMLQMVRIWLKLVKNRDLSDQMVYRDMLLDLGTGQNITPLTNNPEEWEQVTPTLWRSNRNRDAFSGDGGSSFWLRTERRPNHTAPTHLSDRWVPPEPEPLPPEPDPDPDPEPLPEPVPEDPTDG